MKYNKIVQGKFISRPNRFIAHVEINGKAETVHVKNTGRCKELLVPNATVYLSVSDNPCRKTAYDLVAVIKDENSHTPRLVNMDSQIVNDVGEEYLKSVYPNSKIKREVTYNSSRFDFYIENGKDRIFVEAKGVTLERDGIVLFPDAPTERGIKHLNELIAAKKEGYDAYVLFIIQMENVKYFTPNDVTHKAFGDALRRAKENGVNIIAIDCRVKADELLPNKQIEVVL